MTTIDELIGNSANKTPGKTALRFKVAGSWQSMTYRQLWEDVQRTACGLRQWGIRKGDRIALIGGTSAAWITAYLGSLQSAAVVVPVDKELKAGELRHVLGDCGARLIFTDLAHLGVLTDIASNLHHLEKIVTLDTPPEKTMSSQIRQTMGDIVDAWRELARQYRISTEEQQRVESLGRNLERMLLHPEERKVAGTRTEGIKSVFNDMDETRRSFFRRYAVEPLGRFGRDGDLAPVPGRAPTDTAVILYTSGTMGRSKGAMLSHANIVTNIKSALPHLEVGEGMHTLSFLPINHVFEQVAGVLAPLSVNGTVSIAESLKKIGQNLVEEKPTYVMGVPAVYRVLLNRIRRGIEEKPLAKTLFSIPFTRSLVTAKIKKSFGKNITFISGGAALDPEIARGITSLGITILQGYGITETSPIIAAESPHHRKLGTVGRTIPGVEVRIDHPNEEGVGEILVKGPNVMQGYYKRPRATAEVIVDGWYRTGDLGHLDAKGYLTIRGRVKNLIVTPNGKNVYPEEVENELLKSPFVAEVMVYGHKLNDTSEEVHAIIYPDQEALDNHVRQTGCPALNEADVKELIRQEVLEVGNRLADYKRIKRFTLRDDEFPKTTTRKIKRYVVEADIPASR